MQPLPDLERECRRLLAQIPCGRVSTFGSLARALGSVQAAKWLGQLLRRHSHDDQCLCHRVVTAAGDVTDATGRHARRLQSEGIDVSHGVVALERFRFDDFEGPTPLAALVREQHELAARVALTPGRTLPAIVGAVDLAYATDATSGTVWGVGAYVLTGLDGSPHWQTTIRSPITFPYISGLLAYRELPVLVALLDEARRAGQLAPVVLVDGSGILHPRGAGIATHLGLVSGTPTIGVTKKRLCGELNSHACGPHDRRSIYFDGRLVGAAFCPRPSSHDRIYVSPGNGVDASFAAAVVERLLLGKKLPAPLYWADRLSRQTARQVSA